MVSDIFFILSKILKFFLYPFTWIILLWILSLLLKSKPLKRAASLTGLLLLLLLSNRFIAEYIIGQWQYPLIPYKKLEHHDIALTLGGGASYRKSDPDRVFLNPSADRVMQPVELYKLGKVNTIFYSGGAGSLTAPKISEAREVKKLYKILELPDSVLYFEESSRNTNENAAFSAIALKEKFSGKSVLLITSPLHMKRSMECFEKQGIKCTPFPISIISYEVPPTFDYYIIPDIEALNLWHEFLHEFFGWVSYKLMGFC